MPWRQILGVVLLIVLLNISPVIALTKNPDITIDAQEMEYDLEAKAVVATGDVTLVSEELEIRCEQMVYFDNGWIEVSGSYSLQEKNSYYEGDGLRYHIPTRKAELGKVKGNTGDYYISGRSGSISPENVTFTGGNITRCDREKPHYHLHAGRIRITEGQIIIERGWLSVLGIPVFPIPYLSLSKTNLATWPDIKAGATNERGFYGTVANTFTISPELLLRGGIGLGTKDWWAVNGKAMWNPSPDFSWDLGFNAESIDRRAETRLSYEKSLIAFDASAYTEWVKSEERERNWIATASWAPWKRGEHGVWFDLLQEERYFRDYTDSNADGMKEWYGGQLPGARLRYQPNNRWQIGYGQRYADGDFREPVFNDWFHEASLDVSQPMGDLWHLTVSAIYQWNDGSERWDKQEIGLTRLFHCISTRISWDGVDEDWNFSVGIKW